jgi:hypothetical protein
VYVPSPFAALAGADSIALETMGAGGTRLALRVVAFFFGLAGFFVFLFFFDIFI